MTSEPRWITDKTILIIHDRQILLHGGENGLRDRGLLESALAKPRNLYHYNDPKPSVAEIAAAYAHGIARNHAFIDGNKRTAMTACHLFLLLNDMKLKATVENQKQAIKKLATGDFTEQEFAQWISTHTST